MELTVCRVTRRLTNKHFKAGLVGALRVRSKALASSGVRMGTLRS